MSSHGPRINYHCGAKTLMNAPLIPRISPRLKGQGNETIVKSPHPGAIKDGENWVNIRACPRLSPSGGGGGGVVSNDWCSIFQSRYYESYLPLGRLLEPTVGIICFKQFMT